jgi:uncharacterized membrane protein
MRLLRHLFARSAQALFPPEAMARIAAAIDAGERRHAGEICFAVESALPIGALLRGVSARIRAERAFERMRVWDTQANNGVLLYLLLADHRIEIVADRGLHGKVSDEQWRGVCQLMEERLRDGNARRCPTCSRNIFRNKRAWSMSTSCQTSRGSSEYGFSRRDPVTRGVRGRAQ